MTAAETQTRRAGAEAPTRRVNWWSLFAGLLLAAYLLLAHGCHGDADTELFALSAGSSSAAAGR
jgi:hypothetical protein